MAYNWDTHKEQLAKQWAAMKILRQRSEMERSAHRIITFKNIYQEVERKTGVPWYMVGVIDLREGGESKLTKTHLHCGDPLSNYTVHVPSGRPQIGHGPPFGFVESACDALVTLKHFDRVTDWSIERILHELEPYNGLGYYNKGIPSPYIWSCTNQYDPPHGPGGKYVADGVFDPHVVDKQVGIAPLIKVMSEIDTSIVLRSYRTGAPIPAPAPAPKPVPSQPAAPKPAPGPTATQIGVGTAGGAVAAGWATYWASSGNKLATVIVVLGILILGWLIWSARRSGGADS